MREKNKAPEAPIGIIASLSAGLDTVIQGWWIILFPLSLDLFLWLGPHLSIRSVAESALTNLAILMGDNPLIDLLREAAGELNYFSILSVTPLGVPSLISLKLPQGTPLGLPTVFLVDSEWLWLALFLGLSLGGLLVGGVYLGLIGQQVRDKAFSLPRLLAILPRYWASVLLMIVMLLLIGIMLTLPIMAVATLLAAWSDWLATLLVWLGFMFFLWLLYHLFFTVHGILVNEQSLPVAALTSLRLVSFNSFSTMGLVTLALSISTGLNYLWMLPKGDSWMLLVGIVGHALISSGLIAATFVYYQDRHRHWQELQAYLKSA